MAKSINFLYLNALINLSKGSKKRESQMMRHFHRFTLSQ